ncbi:MAG: UbiA family prenyltransferase [Betaproteobacteria bacterium]
MNGPPMDTVESVPLVVDLDGTLLRSDLLYESTFKLLQGAPWLGLALPAWLASGKAVLKRRIAQRAVVDIESLPFDVGVVDWMRGERAAGRRLVLCTASDTLYAEQVALHLDLFDEVIASDGRVNMSAHRKAATLVGRFGERGFDYAGNSSDDLPVWAVARRAVVVGAPAAVRRALDGRVEVEREFLRAPAGVRTWLRALRVHQWLKNLLLFLPVLGAHQIFNLALLPALLVAFLAFGSCASAVYLLNDLIDLDSDRRHPRKRKRPFAAGDLSPLSGALASCALAVLAFALALWVGWLFTAWLAVYFALTLAYTFWLKRKVLVDVLSLSGLYTLRIVAGGAAAGIAASFWLLAFSLFLFLSLALVKRYSELQVVLEQGKEQAHGRGYWTDDLPLVQSLGIAAGFSAVLVMALYINGESVQRLYRHPEAMWLAVPILLYWVSRVWVKTHRGQMHDDPVMFAVRDPVSLVCGALFVGVLATAALLP